MKVTVNFTKMDYFKVNFWLWVTVNFTKMDYFKVNFWLWSKRAFPLLIILILMFTVIFTIFYLSNVKSFDFGSFILELGKFVLLSSLDTIPAFILIILAGLIIRVLIYHFGKQGVLCSHEYLIDEKGIYEKTSVDSSQYNWKKVSSIKVFGQYLVIRIGIRLIYVLPKRDFDSEQDFEEFIEQANLYWNNTKKTSS